MAQYCSVMMRLTFMHGFKNNRWAKYIDVMLEKKPGVKKIHLLRIISLVEADFNTALNLYFTEHLVSNLEKTELTKEQWGGRRGQQATYPVLKNALL